MIYLDHAAATPMSEAAIQAMLPYLRSDFYNPSAPYLPAKHVREIYEAAKNRIAHAVGAKGVDLVMTAGATESINLAFTACKHRALVLATEHHAVINVAEQYNSTYLQVNRDGVIDLADFKRQLTDEVDFVSIALANNEIGTIQP
ncbi:MAG: aminotransferase class V-fold PLP-dependent enzyme, partial [Firmicutes bacterium]|nr:aminotransferase class V-fold PLP-dependent enzyme [Bacillota bacterium]